MKVVVIGAGVIGSATAYALSRAGARVTVCEAKYPGAGTSGESYAWVNANRKEPREYFELNLDGMRAHNRWHQDLAEGAGALGQWLWRTGHLEWSTDPTHSTLLDEKLERMADWGYPAQVLEPRDALASIRGRADLIGAGRERSSRRQVGRAGLLVCPAFPLGVLVGPVRRLVVRR